MVSFWKLPVLWQKSNPGLALSKLLRGSFGLGQWAHIYVPTLGIVLNRCIYNLTTSTLFVTFCRHSSRALDEHRDLCETRIRTESWVQVRYQNIFIYVHFSIDYQRIYTHWLISPFVYFIMRDYCSGCSILVEKYPPTSTGDIVTLLTFCISSPLYFVFPLTFDLGLWLYRTLI